MPPVGLFGNQTIGRGAEKGINQILGNNRNPRMRRLSPVLQKLVRAGGLLVYVYNVSEVFDHKRPVQGRGQAYIPRRKAGEAVSEALVIPAFLVRDFDRGNRTREQFVEEGEDIAMDILGCNPNYPILDVNNLTLKGCFYTIGKQIEELTEKKRSELIDTANLKHEDHFRRKVLEADQYHSSNHGHWITEMYRLCALHLQERFPREDWTRDWVAKRGRSTVDTDDCAFCGYTNRSGVVKCQNCKEILNQEAYDKLVASRKKA